MIDLGDAGAIAGLAFCFGGLAGWAFGFRVGRRFFDAE